ncbi:MAG TPA: adenosylcobinamide-GDP ribazoletransferase [Micromonosporaceae bacterium]|nr:adenosylcobinamide-GDP ribazoletransferase [Micromonosporaceae bacterium]
MWTDGLRLAVTTFTVAPISPPSRLDRAVAGWAMRFAPLVGAVLGLVLAGILEALRWLGFPGLLAGALTVGAGALLSRGLHLDGLADTVDALGSYRSRERALAVMKSPEVGAFGVAALALALLIQSAAITFVTVPGLIVAVAAGRLAAAIACRRGVPAARPDGLGALVAGTVGWPALIVNALAIAAVAVWAVPGRPWQGPAAVAMAIVLILVLQRHLVRRLGGITGDVLGFLIEVASTLVLIGLCAGALPR